MEDDSKLTVIKKQMGNKRNMTQKYQRKVKKAPWLSHLFAGKFCTNTDKNAEVSDGRHSSELYPQEAIIVRKDYSSIKD